MPKTTTKAGAAPAAPAPKAAAGKPASKKASAPARSKAKAAAATVLTFPGQGRKPDQGERAVFITHGETSFEVQLASNTLIVPPGRVEVRSNDPYWSALQVAHHICSTLAKRGGYKLEAE